MKKKIFLLINMTFFMVSGICMAEAPHQVGGFVLNRDIADFKDMVIMETTLPIRHMENIKEVEIKPIEGFKSGLIAYGTCAAPGHIIRIKLKYMKSSKNFYEKLLKQFKKRFGKPDEYRGDPFHIVIGWKWSFVDSNNNRISLTLQHNSMDEEAKRGNAVKLTMTNMIEKDRQCYTEKELDQREKLRRRKWEVKDLGLSGWDLFIPR